LNVTKKGKDIICDDLETLRLILGTTAVSSNLHMYNITKKGTTFIVPVESITKRINELTIRVEKTNRSLEIMKQIVVKKCVEKQNGNTKNK